MHNIRTLMRACALLVAGALGLGLAGCAGTGAQSPVVTTSSGKTVVSLPRVGVIGVQLAAGVQLVASLYEASAPSPSAIVLADAEIVRRALLAASMGLEQSGQTTGDLHANVAAAVDTVRALAAAAVAADPALAPKIHAAEGAFAASLALYNAQAGAAGLPQVAIPALAA